MSKEQQGQSVAKVITKVMRITFKALSVSKFWNEKLYGIPVVAMASVPPLDMTGWSDRDHYDVRRFAAFGGDVPKKLADFLDSIPK